MMDWAHFYGRNYPFALTQMIFLDDLFQYYSKLYSPRYFLPKWPVIPAPAILAQPVWSVSKYNY